MADSRAAQAAGTAGLFLALSWIFVLLRCYCRIAIVRRFGPEDYLCIISQVFFSLYGSFVLVGVHYGTGRHLIDIVPLSNAAIALKWWWLCELLYCLSSLTVKFSIGVFLLRIVVHRSQTIILWTVMVVSAVMSTYFFLLFLFQCQPVGYFWGQYTGMNGRCIDPVIISRTAYVYSAISCWSDWTFCILPGFMVWNIQMNPRTKASVLLLFALGAVASTTTIVRFPYLSTLQDKSDFLYATSMVGILSTSEIGIGITTSAAATLRPLFHRFLGRSQTNSGPIELSRPWSRCPARAGYVRNREGGPSLQDPEHIGVTTVTTVESHSIVGRGNSKSNIGIRAVEDSSRTHVPKNWHTSKLEDASSEEERLT